MSPNYMTDQFQPFFELLKCAEERKLLKSKFETRYVLEISKQLDRFSVWKITSVCAFVEYS